MDPKRQSSAALPGFSAPAAGFDEPLEMLHACHDRVRRSLDLLERICQRVEQSLVDQAVHSAAADVLHYFDRAAPHHHEDEEQHVFPRVLAGCDDPAVRAIVLALQEDHIAMESQWAALRTPLAALATGHGEGFDAAHLAAARRFCALYAQHAQTEEALVFPTASKLIDDDAKQAMGREMATRRGARLMPPV